MARFPGYHFLHASVVPPILSAASSSPTGYSPPETRAERVKVNVYILGRDLRADGIRAAVFRQVQNGSGAWVDADVRVETSADLENAILTRARQLRIASIQ